MFQNLEKQNVNTCLRQATKAKQKALSHSVLKKRPKKGATASHSEPRKSCRGPLFDEKTTNYQHVVIGQGVDTHTLRPHSAKRSLSADLKKKISAPLNEQQRKEHGLAVTSAHLPSVGPFSSMATACGHGLWDWVFHKARASSRLTARETVLDFTNSPSPLTQPQS